MEDINELLQFFSGNVYDFCFHVLNEAEDREKVFEIVCKQFVEKPQNGRIEIPKYFTEDEIDKLKSLDGEIIDGIIDSTIKKCNAGLIETEKFYYTLWNAFCSWFVNNKEQAFAMYYTVIDSRIPYVYVGMPLSMNNERYKELVEKNKDYLDKIRYISRSNYKQHTERASLLLNCLAEITDYESKVVVLAQAIKILTQTSRRPSLGDIDEHGLGEIMRLLDKEITERHEETEKKS